MFQMQYVTSQARHDVSCGQFSELQCIEINDNWGAEGPARRAGAYWAGQVPTPGAAWQGTRQRLLGRSGVCGGRSGYSLVTD